MGHSRATCASGSQGGVCFKPLQHTEMTTGDSEPIEALKKAVDGGELDGEALEPLRYSLERCLAIRDVAIPLVMQLIEKNPKAAQHLPETVVVNFLHGLSLQETLQRTLLDSSFLKVQLVRPLLLSILVDKVNEKDAPLTSPSENLIQDAFRLLEYVDLETKSVALIEQLTAKLPDAALKYIPFEKLFAGVAELQVRLMGVNVKLLARKKLPPLDFLVWHPLVSEEDDILLSALQIDYLADLVGALIQFPQIEPKITLAFHDICQKYGSSLLNQSIERALAKLANIAEPLFLELDAQFLLIKPSRPSLIAQVPYEYIVKRHPEVIDQLELNAANIYAIANISQTYLGLRLLRLSPSRLLSLPRQHQLIISAAATNTPEGAELFRDQCLEVLQNAVDTPESDETRDLKATLRANLIKSNIRLRKQPGVQVV